MGFQVDPIDGTGGPFISLTAQLGRSTRATVEASFDIFELLDGIADALSTDVPDAPGLALGPGYSTSYDQYSQQYHLTDPTTGLRVRLDVVWDEDALTRTPLSVSVMSGPTNGSPRDRFMGNVYFPGFIGVGEELNGLSQFAHENYVRGNSLLTNSNGYVPISLFGDGDPRNDNDWRLSEDDWRHSSNQPNWGPSPVPSSSSPSYRGDPYRDPYAEDLPGWDKGPAEPVGNTPTPKDVDGNNGLTPPEGPTKEHPNGPVGPCPIILDLDSLGITVTELSQFTQFVDGGDGLEHRTAWAGVGDGVLFFDVGGDGEITEQREYVFTEWDPTASSDLEALRSYFDTNVDGKLDAMTMAG